VTEYRLHVDGEDFIVAERPEEPGVHDFTWVSDHHDPHYGFTRATSSERTLSESVMRAAISDFLSQINPETGYMD